MIITISLSILLLSGLIMYLVLLGANKSKTEEEIELEDQEQIEYLRRKRHDRQNKKKRHFLSRFRGNRK